MSITREMEKIMKRRKMRNFIKRIFRNFIILIMLLALCKSGLALFPKTANTIGDWNLILVNHSYQIPKDYEIELKELPNGKQVDVRIYNSLMRMISDGASEGYYMIVVEAYRTEAEQQTLMDEKVSSYIDEGYSKIIEKQVAKSWVAVTGTSEHQLGIAVDINPNCQKSGREVYGWLAENAHEYGFILRYPEDKVHITGIQNEPWHYRYVGEQAAAEMYEQKICLEEYVKE